MRSSELVRALAICATVRQAVFVKGPPGGGKSHTVHRAMRAINYKMRDVRLAIMDPVDVGGMPVVENGRTSWSIPNWFPREDEDHVGLFLDEWSQATPMTQNAASTIIYDRQLNGHTLPEDTFIVGAGNNKSDRAATSEMPTHIRNRWLHLEFETDINDWVRWANNPDEEETINLPAYVPGQPMREEIVSFLRYRPDALHKMSLSDAAFPSPRSWSFVNKILPYVLKDTALQIEMVQGCVGEGAAAEFLGYVRLRHEMPDPEAIFAHPDTAPIPAEKPAIMYALMVALSRRVVKGKTNNALFQYLARKDFPQDFAVMCVKDTLARDATMLQCVNGTKWAAANSGLML